ncbi:MAG: hypothetical protein AAGA71_13270 [Pseudomonadota bacterium]
MSISEALEETRLAQKRLNLMLHAFNQLEENDGIGSKSSKDFHESSVGEAHDALNKAKKQLSETQATTAEAILRKVALLVDVDHDELLAPVKADIEVLIDPRRRSPRNPRCARTIGLVTKPITGNTIIGKSSGRVVLGVDTKYLNINKILIKFNFSQYPGAGGGT